MPADPPVKLIEPANPFIERWQNSAAAERANYALFLSELCDYLEVPRPHPAVADDRRNQYVFERAVTFRHPTGLSSTGFIDLYKRGCFVLEAKQGSQATEPSLLFEMPHRRGTAIRGTAGWDQAMLRARNQAEQYAKALPAADGWPPFLIVVDVGFSIELFADFSGTGKAYVPFPDSLTHRILLEHLETQLIRDRLRAIWLEPFSLDPSRISARVTRDVAEHLANLARSLEQDHPAEAVTPFLMRCIFTFFAEDIHLLPPGSFSNLLASLRDDLSNFKPMIESLWRSMDAGGFSPILRQQVLRFNGGLFESTEALPLNRKQFDILCLAAASEWKDVEPAIFGTLLERALDPRERHSLGAHYTPRAYVERLVIPTIVEPLRQDWADVQAAALTLERAGKTADAIVVLTDFRRRLCSIEVLDPACGTGNFLYVTLEHLKRLEGEINDQRERIRFLGEQLDAHRKRRQEAHPNLTLTEMYNVLEELRAGQPLSPASQIIHDRGLVSVLRDLHDDLDRAVAEAYGWSPDLSSEDILFRLVELNAARAAEERSGLVRWLRPEFQKTTATQSGLDVEMEEEELRPARAARLPWPPYLPDRVRAVRDYLMQIPAPVAPETVARNFIRARIPEVTAILETLTALGQANHDDSGYRA